ncbi:MAG: ATP-binding protein [Myxococcota bacterium]
MKIGARLFGFAVALPAAAIAGALGAEVMVVEELLLDSVDRALQAQAAVEAVSLFDERPEPHLHAPEDAALKRLARFAASRAVLDPQGQVILHSEGHQPADLSLAGLDLSSGTLLRTAQHPEGDVREIFVQVTSPKGERYVLWIGEPLAETQRVVRQLISRGIWIALIFAVAAGGIASLQSRRLTQRIRGLGEHMRALESGRLDAEPPPDPGDDELSFLRGRVAAATSEIRRSREADERWIADAAHELRTPLAGIAATIDVTLRRDRSKEELVETMKQARLEVDRLTRLAEDLLALHVSRREAAQAERVDLRALLDEVAAGQLSRAKAQGLELVVSGASGINAEAPRAALRRALENLVDNAIKFSPKGGTVELELRTAPDGHEIRVLDDGPGIPRAEADFVFEAFHRVDHRKPGFGLGLALVREVAEKLHGRAYVATAQGEGRSALALWWPARG